MTGAQRTVCSAVQGVEILNITANQIVESLLAIPAFVPATVCTGYLAAWFTNLHNFRQRSLVERIFWSVPLSLGVSTISSVLVGKFLSLSAVVVLLLASAAFCLFTLGTEWLQLRHARKKWQIGWRPLGGMALLLAVLWVAVAIASLVDFQVDQQLFMSLTIFDHAPRVNWTESILRSGIPPNNPLYWYMHPASMRYYYFWYVVCAAITRISHLSVRAVFIASCVWSGFGLVAIIGLYLKHFLSAGVRLRKQFLRCASLLMVTGLGICVNLWNFFHLQTLYIEVWPAGQTTSWSDSLLYDPHHVASLTCCMLAFLLAWMSGIFGKRRHSVSVIFIAASLASAFGLSIYVTFAFFVVILLWALWQVAIERTPRPALLLGAGGVGAALLLLPYLSELTHTVSKMKDGSLFSFSVRETIPPDTLMASTFFSHIAIAHPLLALNLARLVLLSPGYTVELGFYLLVFLMYAIPAWHGRIPLTPAQRSMVFIAAVTLPMMSLLRSGVLVTNDFGWRASLFFLFPMLLLGSEVITAWNLAERKIYVSAETTGLPRNMPGWLRSVTALALLFGVFTTVFQAMILRFNMPIAEANLRRTHDPKAGKIPHNAYISSLGYEKLDAAVPHNAIIQFNPARSDPYLASPDFLGINHQTAIASDQLWCGSELGGDPGGCPAMAAAIDALFTGASAEQARTTCRHLGIDYLVATVYDPAWKNGQSWVWTLRPVVSDEEFRALDCRQ